MWNFLNFAAKAPPQPRLPKAVRPAVVQADISTKSGAPPLWLIKEHENKFSKAPKPLEDIQSPLERAQASEPTISANPSGLTVAGSGASSSSEAQVETPAAVLSEPEVVSYDPLAMAFSTEPPRGCSGAKASGAVISSDADKPDLSLKRTNFSGPTISKIKDSLPELAEKLVVDINRCLNEATASGTSKTYQSMIISTMSALPEQTWKHFLPCTSSEHLMIIFSQLSGKAWGTIRVCKAAIRMWHYVHGFGAEWGQAIVGPLFSNFWSGLKRTAGHSSHAKLPLTIDQYKTMVDACINGKHDTLAGTRDAAWLAVSFFGVRRVSETSCLTIRNVSFDAIGFTIVIEKAKNDQFGKGSTCLIPPVPDLGTACPYKLIKAWWERRKCDQLFEALPFVCITKGKRMGFKVSDAALRQRMDQILIDQGISKSISTHSLRKGGATWWKSQGLSSDNIQHQGGWVEPSTMEKVYIVSTEEERKKSLAAAARSIIPSLNSGVSPPAQVVPPPASAPHELGPLWSQDAQSHLVVSPSKEPADLSAKGAGPVQGPPKGQKGRPPKKGAKGTAKAPSKPSVSPSGPPAKSASSAGISSVPPASKPLTRSQLKAIAQMAKSTAPAQGPAHPPLLGDPKVPLRANASKAAGKGKSAIIPPKIPSPKLLSAAKPKAVGPPKPALGRTPVIPAFAKNSSPTAPVPMAGKRETKQVVVPPQAPSPGPRRSKRLKKT